MLLKVTKIIYVKGINTEKLSKIGKYLVHDIPY